MGIEMNRISKLSQLEDLVKNETSLIMAVAAGEDPATINAIARVVNEGIVDVILVGDESKISDLASQHSEEFANQIEIVHEPNVEKTGDIAVQLVHDGRAHFLMKGLIGTATFMKSILNREAGLMEANALLSHVAVMEIPTYSKLLLISDPAIIPIPTMDEKVKILQYCIEVANGLGIQNPKAALVSAAEKINFKLQSSIDAAVIKAMADRKQIHGAIVDGPLALDVSLSKKHCQIKGLESPIDGEADIIIFPNIETGNTFYKSVTILANGKSASIVVGTKVPVVLTSRADDDDSKYYSVILAARIARHRTQ